VRILISAGEASGEMYGAQLMEALRRHLEFTFDHVGTAPPGCPAEQSSATLGSISADKSGLATQPLEFFGVGSEKMRAAGCEIVADSKDLAVVGITEILGHLPKIWGLFHKLIAEAERRKPDLAIVIDSPAFNWRVARQMKKGGIPVVYYVCPQFWAWRQGRVRLLRKYVDKALMIFPFEEKFYRDRGVDAQFVGHPLANIERPSISREEYAAQNGMTTSKPWITLMPGSREREVRMNLPTILDSAQMLGSGYEFLLPIAPTLDLDFMQSLIKERSAAGTSSTRAVNPSAPDIGTAESQALAERNVRERIGNIHVVADALPALAHSRAGIIASGTATVEAALMDLPFVMVYKVTRLTYFLGRSTVKVPYFAMVNLIAGRQIVPELVQNAFTPENVVAEVNKVIPDSDSRRQMLEGLKEVRQRLAGPEQSRLPAADRAARTILAMLLEAKAAQAG
jgi:lipid-A-disaccharide synthase